MLNINDNKFDHYNSLDPIIHISTAKIQRSIKSILSIHDPRKRMFRAIDRLNSNKIYLHNIKQVDQYTYDAILTYRNKPQQSPFKPVAENKKHINRELWRSLPSTKAKYRDLGNNHKSRSGHVSIITWDLVGVSE